MSSHMSCADTNPIHAQYARYMHNASSIRALPSDAIDTARYTIDTQPMRSRYAERKSMPLIRTEATDTQPTIAPRAGHVTRVCRHVARTPRACCTPATPHGDISAVRPLHFYYRVLRVYVPARFDVAPSLYPTAAEPVPPSPLGQAGCSARLVWPRLASSIFVDFTRHRWGVYSYALTDQVGDGRVLGVLVTVGVAAAWQFHPDGSFMRNQGDRHLEGML